MASQGISRKRPAPESPPTPYQQPMQHPINGYAAAVGPQLSDDQFFQWGQTTQPSNQYQDPSTYNQSLNSAPPSGAQPTNQLTRRPLNQIATRGKAQDNTNGLQWIEPSIAATQQHDKAWGDDLDDLERQAAVAKRESQGRRKQIPPFVQKLNSFLEDGKNTELIRWSEDGNSFIVVDEDEFAKTLIPELFKHNNYASFVRQLNMYGFHKKVGLSDNSMRASERKNKSPSEYSNPYFRRGHPDLLWLIQKPKNATGPGAKGKNRNKADSEQNDEDADEYIDEPPNIDHRVHPKTQLAIDQGETSLSTERLQSVQRELGAIRRQQQQIANMMQQLKREHEQLYGQAATFQDQHTRHENSINAILTFLATVYNRSLNGNDGAQGIAGLFANSIPHDTSQGSVVDVGDYNFDALNSDSFAKPFKKQPLLLQGPQADSPQGRASTVSPNPSNDPYQPRQTRRMSQALRSGNNPQAGNVEELFDSNANSPIPPQDARRTSSQQPDIMSVIQNTNARNSTPGTPATDFNNVLNTLENSGGNTPLTSSQRANMLRLMNDSANQTGDNALVNATPPSMPKDYGHNLAKSRADLDSLAKLQAEQDKSVQTLTSLLQPLSPTGSIPGIHDGQSLPPPPLDIDSFLNQDYFADFPSDGQGNYDFNGVNIAHGNGLNFADLPNDDDELFSGVPANGQPSQDFGNFGSDGVNDDGGGRVESVDSSEATTPNTTADSEGVTTRSTRSKGRKMSAATADGEKSPAKRRKRNG